MAQNRDFHKGNEIVKQNAEDSLLITAKFTTFAKVGPELKMIHQNTKIVSQSHHLTMLGFISEYMSVA